MTSSLFDKYGGFAQVNRIVMDFYDAMLDSEEVGPYFDEIEMPRLIDHQTKFIAYILGGPADYPEEQLRVAHHKLGVSDAHFEEMKSVLAATFRKFGMEEADVERVIEQIEARRPLIVK